MLKKIISRTASMFLAVCMMLQLMPVMQAAASQNTKTLDFITKDTVVGKELITAAKISERNWELDTTRTSASLLGRINENAYDYHRLDGAGLVSLMNVGDKLVILFDVEKDGVYKFDAVLGSFGNCANEMSIAIDRATISTNAKGTPTGGFVNKEWGSAKLGAGRHYMEIQHTEVDGSNNFIYLQKITITLTSELSKVVTFGVTGSSNQLLTTATLAANGWQMDSAKSHLNTADRASQAGYISYYYASPDGFICLPLLSRDGGEYIALTFNVPQDGKYDASVVLMEGGSECASKVSVYVDDITKALISSESLEDGTGWSEKSLGNMDLKEGNHTLFIKNEGEDDLGIAYMFAQKLILNRTGDMSADAEIIFGAASSSTQLITTATLEDNGWQIDSAKSHANIAGRAGNAGYIAHYYASPQGFIAAPLLSRDGGEYIALTFSVTKDGAYDASVVLKEGGSECASDVSVYVDKMILPIISNESLEDGTGWSEKSLGRLNLTAGNHTLIIKNDGEDDLATACVYINKLILKHKGNMTDDCTTTFGIPGSGSKLITAATLADNSWELNGEKSNAAVERRCGETDYAGHYYVTEDFLTAKLKKDEHIGLTFKVAQDGKYNLSTVLKYGITDGATGINVYVDSLDSTALLSGQNMTAGNGWTEKSLGAVNLKAGNHTLVIENTEDNDFDTSCRIYINSLTAIRTGEMELPFGDYAAYIQKTEEGSYTVHALAAIESLDYAKVGFYITVGDGEAVKTESTAVYETVSVEQKTAGTATIKASDFFASETDGYIFKGTQKDIALVYKDASIKITPYAIDQYGQELVGTTYTFVMG